MTIDDLIAGFTELLHTDHDAEFRWRTAGLHNDISIRTGAQGHLMGAVHAILNDAGGFVRHSVDNPGRTPAQRFIVEVFRTVPDGGVRRGLATFACTSDTEAAGES